MSHYSYQGQLQTHTMSHINAADYTPFDEKVEKKCGKQVYIRKDMFMEFTALFSNKRDMHISLSKAISELSAGNGYLPANRPDIGMKETNGYKIFFKLEGSHAVYVTHIEIDYQKCFEIKPGLKEVIESNDYKDVWTMKNAPLQAVQHQHLAINPNIPGDADKIATATAQTAKHFYNKADKLDDALGNKFNLFFNPPEIRLGAFTFTTSKSTMRSHEWYARELGHLLFQLEHSQQPTCLMVQGNGIDLFNTALQQTPAKQLSNVQVLLVTPTGKVKDTLLRMRQKNMTLHDDIIHFNTGDYRSKKALISFGSVGNLNTGTEAAAQAFGDQHAKRIANLKTTANSEQKKLLTTLMTGGFLPSANNPLALISKAQGFGQNFTSNPTINTHAHPTRSNEDAKFDRQQSGNGGIVKDFSSTVEGFCNSFRSIFN